MLKELGMKELKVDFYNSLEMEENRMSKFENYNQKQKEISQMLKSKKSYYQNQIVFMM